jgi:hypothetical protein
MSPSNCSCQQQYLLNAFALAFAFSLAIAGQARWMNPTAPKTYKAGQLVKLQVILSTNHGGKAAQQHVLQSVRTKTVWHAGGDCLWSSACLCLRYSCMTELKTAAESSAQHSANLFVRIPGQLVKLQVIFSTNHGGKAAQHLSYSKQR